jgi:hypothetical protein
MKNLAIVLTTIAVAFTVGIVYESSMLIRLTQDGSISFRGIPTGYILVLSSAALWIPTLALDLACFAIWRLISIPKSLTITPVA